MSSFQSGQADLYYEEYGTGTPLVFLHGASWDGRQWEPQVDYFSFQYRVITLDVRGHGRSSLPPGEVDPRQFSRDVVALLDHLTIEKAVLIGLSMGGHISIQTAAYYPERVERIVLIGAPFTNSFNLYEKLAVPINRWSCRLLSMKSIGKAQAKMLSKFNPEIYDYIMDVFDNYDHDVFNRVWSAVTKMESRDLLAQISCPALLLIGDHDTMTNYQQQTMLEMLQDARLVTIENANHATNLDNPNQVNAAISSFLLK